jgi:hypothetical protein
MSAIRRFSSILWKWLPLCRLLHDNDERLRDDLVHLTAELQQMLNQIRQ